MPSLKNFTSYHVHKNGMERQKSEILLTQTRDNRSPKNTKLNYHFQRTFIFIFIHSYLYIIISHTVTLNTKQLTSELKKKGSLTKTFTEILDKFKADKHFFMYCGYEDSTVCIHF